MQIDDPRIYSYRELNQAEFWAACESFDGNLLVGVAFDENKLPYEDIILLVDHDPYGEIDVWLEYKGRSYWIDLDLHTVRDLKTPGILTDSDLPIALAYYIAFDAFPPDLPNDFSENYLRLKRQTGER